MASTIRELDNPLQNPTRRLSTFSMTVEEYRRLLDRLGNESLRKVAVWKMEGNTSEEIAEKLGCVLRTVERKLKGIRDIWSRELPT